MKNQAREFVIELLKEKLFLKTEEIELHISYKDLGIDSLDLAEIAQDVEDHFKIDIPDKELMEIETLNDALELVSKQLSKNE